MDVGNSVFEDRGIVRIMLGQVYNVEWRLEVVVRFKSYGWQWTPCGYNECGFIYLDNIAYIFLNEGWLAVVIQCAGCFSVCIITDDSFGLVTDPHIIIIYMYFLNVVGFHNT